MPKQPAFSMSLRRQFGLLPLDGANVGVWDSTVVPRPYSREKPTTLSIKFKNMELKGQAILSKRVAIIKPRLSCLELIKVLELKAVRWYEYVSLDDLPPKKTWLQYRSTLRFYSICTPCVDTPKSACRYSALTVLFSRARKGLTIRRRSR